MAILILSVSLAGMDAKAQFVAKMEVKEDIEGICDKDEVYALFPTFQGQEEARCPITKDKILKRLNSEVRFLKENTRYSDKGMIGIIISCNGTVVKCRMDNKTKSPDLDKEIEAVFGSLGEWKAGKLNGKPVDSSRLFSFRIKRGIFTFE